MSLCVIQSVKNRERNQIKNINEAIYIFLNSLINIITQIWCFHPLFVDLNPRKISCTLLSVYAQRWRLITLNECLNNEKLWGG